MLMMAARGFAGLVALEHFWFFVMEFFLWTTPGIRKTFGTTPEFAESTAALMKNQGTYNAFLAAGLLWAAVTSSRPLALFFLGCVIVAAIVGGLTAKKSILVVQGGPAAIGFALWLALS
jgi:putative membrane protein